MSDHVAKSLTGVLAWLGHRPLVSAVLITIAGLILWHLSGRVEHVKIGFLEAWFTK